MKEKIFQALRAKIIDPKTGKTSISDKTLNAYVDTIAAQITDESKINEAITPYVGVLNEIQANINSVAAAAAIEKETALKTAHEAEIAALKTPGKNPDPNQPDVSVLVKSAVEEAMKPLQDKLQGYEAKEKISTRQALIASKAKEHGIPEWRQKEGFTIADDADEASINATMAAIKQNLVTAGLEGKNDGAFSLSSSKEQSKEEAKRWAESLPDK